MEGKKLTTVQREGGNLTFIDMETILGSTQNIKMINHF